MFVFYLVKVLTRFELQKPCTVAKNRHYTWVNTCDRGTYIAHIVKLEDYISEDYITEIISVKYCHWDYSTDPDAKKKLKKKSRCVLALYVN